MYKLIPMLFLITVGCATHKAVEPAPTAGAPQEATDDNEGSAVLQKSAKCPRNAKLVNGKCMLQVETTE